MDRRYLIVRVPVIGVLLWISPACSLPRRTYEPPADPSALSDTAFLHYLSAVPTVTVAEGARATLLLVGPTQDWPTFEEQWNQLVRRGAVRDAWRVDPDDTLDKGTLAYMLVHVAGLPEGVSDHLARLTGLGDRRYALKACIDAGVMAYGLPHEAVTGGELLTAIRRLETRGRQGGG